MFKFPKVEVTRINLRPLVSPQELEKVNPVKVLKSLKREVLKQIRQEILQETFTPEAKKALARGVDVKVGPSSITVIAKHPAFRPLLEGQRRQQMRWLTKAKRPIPIVTDSGEVVFRNATPRSMENGSWYHPGRQPTTVLERAKKKTKQVVRERVGKELRKRLRAARVKAGR